MPVFTAYTPRPVPTIEELDRVREFLVETAVNEWTGERDWLATGCMKHFLLRPRESFRLLIADLQRGLVIVHPEYEKTRKCKTYPLTLAPRDFRERLCRYLPRVHNAFAFPTKRGTPMRLSEWVGRRWRTACEAARLNDVRALSRTGARLFHLRPHAFRTVGITMLLRRGASAKEVAAFTQQHWFTVTGYYELIQQETAAEKIGLMLHDTLH